MARGSTPLVDHDVLHRILWARAKSVSPDAELKVIGKDLAAELALSQQAMSRTLQAMTWKGMIRPISTRRRPQPTIYQVADPDGDRFPDPRAKGRTAP